MSSVLAFAFLSVIPKGNLLLPFISIARKKQLRAGMTRKKKQLQINRFLVRRSDGFWC